MRVISGPGCKNRNIWITTFQLSYDGRASDSGDVLQCETEVQFGLELPDDAGELKNKEFASMITTLCSVLPPTAQPRQRGLYAQQVNVEQLLTWFKMGATEVLLSSLLDWTAVWRTAKTVRQELRNQTGVGREADLNPSKLNLKLTHRCYNLLTAGLESTLLVAGEDPLLLGQTSPWFQFSTHKVYSATLFTLTRDLQQFTHWFVPQMRPNMRREGRAAAACCRFSVQTRQRHRD